MKPWKNKNSFVYKVLFSILLSAGILFAFQNISSAKEIPSKEKSHQFLSEDKSLDFDSADTSVEINGDQVEFIQDEDKIVAQGNVVVTKGSVKLSADKIVFSKKTNIAQAVGNVTLSTPQGNVTGNEMTYNFKDMAGDFQGAHITADPYYGSAQEIAKIEENHLRMTNGYLTTCDHDKPHFRLLTKKVDIYPGEKVYMRNVKMMLGPLPVLWLPRYSHVLNDKKPRVLYTPGYDKDWGAFLLTRWRYYFNDNLKGDVRLDYRERKDVAVGLDTHYKVPNMGTGIFRTYYMNERNITSKRIWQERLSPTIERERYKAEWRHKWNIDPDTEVIWQYYRVSDPTFLKEYFEKEFEEDTNPETFFLATRTLPTGILSFRMDKRVNRFFRTVERLPEIRYDMHNQKIGSSRFYFRSIDTYSNLSLKDPSPTEVRLETQRVDSDNQISYPFKLNIFEVRPFLGERFTYYSKTKDPMQYNVLRTIFSTGSDIATHFYKVYDYSSNFWGVEINKLRHVITPSVAYIYRHNPSITSDTFDVFDGAVESIERDHTVGLALENKLQTKRNGSSVDLFRNIVSTDFRLKEYPSNGGFDRVKTDWEFFPADWLSFYADTDYDTFNEHLQSGNFDVVLDGDDKWRVSLGKRYNRDVDDQITTNLMYRINPKWAVLVYERFAIDSMVIKEQEYTIRRDLHEWEMDINFNETRGGGSEIWLVFKLKAFPDMTVDMGTDFNKHKNGTQSLAGK